LALNETLKSQYSGLFSDLLDALLIALFESSKDSIREVAQVADETLDKLIATIPTDQMIPAFVPILTLKDPSHAAHLLTCIKVLTKVISQADAKTLLQQLSSLLPGLFEAFKSTSADIRKAVVLCLVDIYFVLGEDFMPYLAQLTPTQAKLVQIYCHKRRSAHLTTVQ
jgi:CLIP-associating protein 1/2